MLTRSFLRLSLGVLTTLLRTCSPCQRLADCLFDGQLALSPLHCIYISKFDILTQVCFIRLFRGTNIKIDF